MVRPLLLVMLAGCHSIAGIENVTLSTDSAVVDSTANETSVPSETSVTDTTATETAVVRCPSERGPEMLEITAGAEKFCIDATEVTGEQFAAYAAIKPAVTMPARCGSVVRQYPGIVGAPKGPQFNVSWCDAFAYCSWAGKRLCAAIDKSKPVAGNNSEWTFVCRQGLTTKYPYGETHEPAHCVIGRTAGDALPEPVTSFGNCTGTTPPYSEIYDMSGNVSEWVDECDGTKCHALGGYYGDTDIQALSCASINTTTGMTVEHEAGTILRGLGFRCCKD